MRKIGLGIVEKGLLILAVPALVQVFFLGWTATQQGRAEVLLVKARRAADISLLINGLIQDIYKEEHALKLYTGEFHVGADDLARIAASRKKLSQLRDLLADDSAAQQSLTSVETGIAQGEAIIRRAVAAFETKAVSPQQAAEIERAQHALRLETRHFAGRVITPALIAMGDEQERIALELADERAGLDQSLRNSIIIMMVFNLLMGGGLVVLTTRFITARLAALALKGESIGQGAKPKPAHGGSDEISRLDRSLCSMAEEVSRSIERERAIFEGAADIICVLDMSLHILSLSPSVQEIGGYSRESLTGKQIWNLFRREENSALQTVLEGAIKDQFSQHNFDGRLSKVEGADLDVLLSVLPGRDTIILIAHDISSLRTAERLKQDLVSLVWRELAAPLGRLEQILGEIGGDRDGRLNEQGLVMVARATESTAHMGRLLSDLAALDELECGAIELRSQVVPAQKLIERAIFLTQSQADEKGCILKLVSASGLVYCDAERVIQVLVNLIGNAIKYAPRASTIGLAARLATPFVEFSVADQGPGIPSEMRSYVFERFAQVQEADGKKGIGLGLAICRALVELHGGHIAVADVDPGTTIVFTLPEERRQLGPAVKLDSPR